MSEDTFHFRTATGARERYAQTLPPPRDPLYAAFRRIQELEDALREQGKFLDRIEAAETGWWDREEMADAQAAIWNVLGPV
jgi:hypothetical protein